jgi:hypothetical protein
MQRAVLAPLVVLMLSLAACETATSYQPLVSDDGVSGGFTEQKLDDSHYRVSFKGDDMSSRSQVDAYLLYRAAELTAVQGDDWFEMVDKHPDDARRARADPSFGPGWGYWRPQWTFFDRPGFSWGGPWMGAYAVPSEDGYQASAVIALGRGAKPAGDGRAFDARQVLQTLRPKIQQPS